MLLIEGSEPVCKATRTAILIASRNAQTIARSWPACAPGAICLRGLAEISARENVARLRQPRRRNIGKNASRARDDEMFGFFLADPFRGLVSTFPKVRTPPADAMGVGGENVDTAFLQHSLGPILGASSVNAGKRPRCQLHPNPGLAHLFHYGVIRPDPRQPFGVGEHRHVALHHNPEKEFFYSRRRDVMWRFYEDIARVGEGKNMSRP